MLVEFKFSNFRSFSNEQTFSMVPSSSTNEDHAARNVSKVDVGPISGVLKSAAIFGANASGKSNFYRAIKLLKTIVMGSLESLGNPPIAGACPFLLNESDMLKPAMFEISFITNGKLYRYGLNTSQEEITEEWLYWTPTTRETLLFHRTGQTVEFNSRSFKEAKPFTTIKDGITTLEKTRNTVPFISVLANFDGEKATTVIEWFKHLRFTSGLVNSQLESYTERLFEKNEKFKNWALKILKTVQINDIVLTAKEGKPDPVSGDALDEELAGTINRISRRDNPDEKELKVVKEAIGFKLTLPLVFESEGTVKLIYLLGAFYFSITHPCVLIIDEFESKFHTLLSQFLIQLFQDESNPYSQLILTSHDTRLLSRDMFRRDQIWFVEKDEFQSSQMYSLLEYKDYYARRSDHYDRDYLAGSYGAIPLFPSIQEIADL